MYLNSGLCADHDNWAGQWENPESSETFKQPNFVTITQFLLILDWF